MTSETLLEAILTFGKLLYEGRSFDLYRYQNSLWLVDEGSGIVQKYCKYGG